MPGLARQAKVAGAVASAALWHVGLGAARPHDLADLIAGLLVQSRRRVRDTAVVSNLAPQAAFRERHDDPVLVNIKPDRRDTIPQDPSPMHEARHRPIRCNPRYLHTLRRVVPS